jgi:hypothetical protein
MKQQASSKSMVASRSLACAVLFVALGSAACSRAAELPELRTWHVAADTGAHRFFIEAPGEFRIGFVRAMNYGLSEWYDLHHDPDAKSNLTRRDLGKAANGFQGALFNQVINPHDVIAHIGLAGTRFKDVEKTLEIIEDGPLRVIVEASYYTMLSSTVSKEFKLRTRYAIYPTGRIYIRNTLTFEADYTLTTWRHATISLGDPQHYAYGTKEKGTAELVDAATIRNPTAQWPPGALKNMVLQQPKWNTWLITDNTETQLTVGRQLSGRDALAPGAYEIGSSETVYGWLRGNSVTNPHAWSNKSAAFAFVYWDKTTPAPYADYSRASLLLAPAPENRFGGSPALHSWLGFKRYYYGGDMKIPGKKGEAIVQHYFIQLGAEESALLPDIRTADVGRPFATSYLTPIPGLTFDRSDGCYRLDLRQPTTITVAGRHPSPVVVCRIE